MNIYQISDIRWWSIYRLSCFTFKDFLQITHACNYTIRKCNCVLGVMHNFFTSIWRECIDFNLWRKYGGREFWKLSVLSLYNCILSLRWSLRQFFYFCRCLRFEISARCIRVNIPVTKCSFWFRNRHQKYRKRNTCSNFWSARLRVNKIFRFVTINSLLFDKVIAKRIIIWLLIC